MCLSLYRCCSSLSSWVFFWWLRAVSQSFASSNLALCGVVLLLADCVMGVCPDGVLILFLWNLHDEWVSQCTLVMML